MDKHKYKFYCFECKDHFIQSCSDDDLRLFNNEYGEWIGLKCSVCQNYSKRVGMVLNPYGKTETIDQPGGTRQISSAMLKEIKSGTRTKDGQFLSGKEGREYQLARLAGKI